MNTNRNSSKRLLKACIVLALATLTSVIVAGCDDELIDDVNFHLWCGPEELCSWKLEAGHIRQAPTWHKNDHGVELVDTPTTISQELKRTATCLVFSTIADVEANAQVTIALDFNADGKMDYEQPVAAVGFREVKTNVTAPVRTSSPPRIYISKKGQGRAVLAQIRLQEGNAGDCTAPAKRLEGLKLGEACSQQSAPGDVSECASDGTCCEGICAECCVAPKAFDLSDDGGVAKPPEKLCPANADSGVPGRCIHREDAPQFTFFFSTVPLQCDPGMHLRASGAICIGDDDCASNDCVGATSTARDLGNVQLDGGAPCSSDFPDAGGKNCTFTSVHEGRCR